MNYFKIATSAEVYAVIFARHRDQLVPFSSFSDPEGGFSGGPRVLGMMSTEYCFKNADAPMIGICTTWPIAEDGKEGNRSHEYWLCLPKEES